MYKKVIAKYHFLCLLASSDFVALFDPYPKDRFLAFQIILRQIHHVQRSESTQVKFFRFSSCLVAKLRMFISAVYSERIEETPF